MKVMKHRKTSTAARLIMSVVLIYVLLILSVGTALYVFTKGSEGL